jgi:uncharacterized protein YxjI
MKMNKKGIILSVLMLFILIFAGCTENQKTDQDTTDDTSAAVTTIHITDAPVDDFTSVVITFSMVKLHSNETGWQNITIDEENSTLDLLNLHLNNITESLTSTNLPIGNYTKLWLVIDNAIGVLEGSTEEINITVPSNTLKIQQLFKLLDGDNDITLEIDLNASIHSYKGGEAYKILPVLGGIMHKHNNQLQFKEQDKNKLKNKVENRKPVVTILVNDEITHHVNAEVNETINFSATETFDAEGDTLSYLWDFGDGSTNTSQMTNHSFSSKGTYQVTLTVSEDAENGLEETDKIVVTVKETSKGNGNGNG